MRRKGAAKNLDYKAFSFKVTEIKQVSDEEGEFFEFEGYGSTFGNEDLGGDVVRPGAFEKSLAEARASGEPVPVLWQHDADMPLGVYVELSEDAKGLRVKGRMPKEDEFVSKRVVPQMKVGSIRKMSIGYRTRKSTFDEENFVRYLDEVELWEISLVTFPMNPQAGVTGFKNAVPFGNLPVAPRETPWDSEAAAARIKEIDDPKSAFLYKKDEDSDEYSLQIADLVDGKLTVIPQALFHVAATAQTKDLPDAVKLTLERYFEKMGCESPFQEKSCVRLDDVSQLDERTLEKLLKRGVFFSQNQAKRIVKLIGSSQRDVETETEREATQLNDALSTLTDELMRI